MNIYKENYNAPLADNITFVVTDECNLRCRYCYECDKQPNNMTWETGKKAVDWLFDTYQNKYDKVIFDFVGGEPFTMIELLEQMLPYIDKRMQSTTKWDKETYMFSFSTNGTMFKNERVRNLIEKHIKHMSVGVSLDGCKEIHDYNRSNSFDELMKWFPYWKKTIPWGSTKSTLNHEAIPYVFESIKFMYNLCLDYMYMNTVYEDVWENGDSELFEKQLKLAADYIIENKLYKTKYISLFDRYLLEEPMTEHNWCGCGSCMLAIDYKGDIFPCLRFKTLNKQKPLIIGNINSPNLDYKKLIPFYFCHNTRNTPDCKNCEARAGCPNCTAFCYDETGSIFDRISYMCEMHKARRRANIYYWNKMAEIEGVTIEQIMKNEDNKPNTNENKYKYCTDTECSQCKKESTTPT